MKFFVIIATDKNGLGSNAVGIGAITQEQANANLSFLPIIFRKLINPAKPAEFMSFNAGKYYVGATDADSGTPSASTPQMHTATVIVKTADGSTAFSIQAADAIPLKGQNTAGEATDSYTEPTPNGETTDETSTHGSSSGCNAGFGLFALAALALAFRKFSK